MVNRQNASNSYQHSSFLGPVVADLLAVYTNQEGSVGDNDQLQSDNQIIDTEEVVRSLIQAELSSFRLAVLDEKSSSARGLSRYKDSLDFWSLRKRDFPRLAIFAREFLSMPLSQVSVERLKGVFEARTY